MPRKLVLVGILMTGVGLALLGYLDPVIRIIFFGQPGLGLAGAGGTFTRSATFIGNFTSGNGQFVGRGAATSAVSVATIVVFVATVVGLLLTIAGSFATGRPMAAGAGPAPAASAKSD